MKTIKHQPINFVQIERFIQSAAAKLKKAGRVVLIDEQTGFQMAYDAMLRASLGFMLSLGKRPRSTIGHHKVMIEFVSEHLGAEYQSIIRLFDMMRRKRNEAIYEPISTISSKEAGDAIVIAKKYLAIIVKDINRHDPQQRLSL